jgi:predicted nucleotidyltransferase component of viral defense system
MSSEEPWEELFTIAMGLTDQVTATVGEPFRWSFGGGTVLMVRLRHRRSKDIDLFIDDRQMLGMFNPRISDSALAVTSDYDESNDHIKLFLKQGEIDVIAASPLTDEPFETAHVLDRAVRLERPGEIIAKKFWHRGNRATARDLFDLAAVAATDSPAISESLPFLGVHARAFLHQLDARQNILKAEFAAIDRLNFELSFDECADIARSILTPLAM